MKSKEYEEITLPFRKKNNLLIAENGILKDKISLKQHELSNLQIENEQLKDWVKRLLEYTNMSEADIKAAVEKDKAIADSTKALSYLMSFAKLYPNSIVDIYDR